MDAGEESLHVIILEDDILLSKKKYTDFREIQEDYADYVASIGPWPLAAVIDLIKYEWPKLLSEEKIARFLQSEDETMRL